MEKYLLKITEIAFSDKFQKKAIKVGFAAFAVLETVGLLIANF